KGQFVAGKERPRCDREVLAAVLAAPAGRTGRTTGEIAGQRTAMRADRLPVVVGPADVHHGLLRLGVGHAEDLGQRQRLGLLREKEVLRHGDNIPYPITVSWI